MTRVLFEDKNALTMETEESWVVRSPARDQGFPHRSNSGKRKDGRDKKRRTYELEARIQRLCTEDILIANEACGWVPSLEVEVHV